MINFKIIEYPNEGRYKIIFKDGSYRDATMSEVLLYETERKTHSSL